MLSYKELQNKAKRLNVKASGSYIAISARIREAGIAFETYADHDAHAPQKTVPKVEPTNKLGKTKAQVKKDNEAAAGLMACGRI